MAEIFLQEKKKREEGVKRITALFATLIFDKEYFTVAQPSSASTTPLRLSPRDSHLGGEVRLSEGAE